MGGNDSAVGATVAVADPTPSSFAGAARDGTRARPTRELDLSRPHHREAAAREAASDALAKHVGDDRHALFEKGGTFTPGGDALKAKVAEAKAAVAREEVAKKVHMVFIECSYSVTSH